MGRSCKVVWNVCWVLLLLSLLSTWTCMGDGELIMSAANSTSCGPYVPCADLNISYPFWDSASCAASPDFVLSNCSSSSTRAHWNSLSATLEAANPGDPPPLAIITNCSRESPYTSQRRWTGDICLSWDASLLTMNFCASLLTSQSFSQFNIPGSVNLTGFAYDAFQFSVQNVYLFFNCTDVASVSQYVNSSNWPQYYWEEESEYCKSHRIICQNELATTSCLSLIAPGKELRLHHDM
ncbi:hypothetical protein GOP47_0010850, partial [Adiantum capillus-veneris]